MPAITSLVTTMTGRHAILDVFRRGTRTYIQGTQIIARACEAFDFDDAVFEQAVFHRITGQIVRAELDCEASSDAIAMLQFRLGDERHAVSIFETGNAAPRRDDPMEIDLQPGQRDGDACVRGLTMRATFESRLNVIVQSVKSDVEARYPAAADVWVSGFRNLSIPVSGSRQTELQEGQITTKLERVLVRGPITQTIWSFTLREGSGIAASGYTTFALREE